MLWRKYLEKNPSNICISSSFKGHNRSEHYYKNVCVDCFTFILSWFFQDTRLPFLEQQLNFYSWKSHNLHKKRLNDSTGKLFRHDVSRFTLLVKPNRWHSVIWQVNKLINYGIFGGFSNIVHLFSDWPPWLQLKNFLFKHGINDLFII